MRLALLAAISALAACPAPRATPAPAAPPPRLVVLMVIDQLPAWTWPARRDAAVDGIARIAGGGRRHLARYPFVAANTAPGHAALGSGAAPAESGILGNEWYRRDAGRELLADEDPAGGSSAIWMRVDGLGDALLRARPASRAVAVALKGRSSILTLGHAGLPLWYDSDCTCFVAGGDPGALPTWLGELAAAHPIAPRIDEPWTPLDPERLAELSGGPDDAPGELAIPGWDATFPHDLRDARNPAKAVIDTPLGNQIVVEAALAAVAHERLGADDDADLLVVSFSAHDYVGHAFGPDSWEAWDTWLRLDRQIGELLRGLDAAVGAGRWALVLSADHGAPELPERRQARGLPGARVSYGVVEEVAEAAAASVAGDGDWIAATRYPTIYLSAAAHALGADLRDRMVDAVIAAVAAMPGIQRADRSADLIGGCDQRRGDEQAICRSLDPVESGEIFYAPAEGTVLHKADWIDAVAHGSLHGYDREVPLVIYAPGVPAGDVDGVVSPLAVAPTVAELLRVPPPRAAREASLLP